MAQHTFTFTVTGASLRELEDAAEDAIKVFLDGSGYGGCRYTLSASPNEEVTERGVTGPRATMILSWRGVIAAEVVTP